MRWVQPAVADVVVSAIVAVAVVVAAAAICTVGDAKEWAE